MRNSRNRPGSLAILLLLGAVLVAAAGCDSSSPSGGPTTYSVQYLVAGEFLQDGSAEITRVFYDDATGTLEPEFDPAEEGWSEVVSMASGDSFYLRAEGTTLSGRLRIQVAVQAADGSLFLRSADGMPFGDGDVWIEIARELLP